MLSPEGGLNVRACSKMCRCAVQVRGRCTVETVRLNSLVRPRLIRGWTPMVERVMTSLFCA